MPTNQILLTQHILPNQLTFAETANFCLLKLSFVELSSGILLTQQVVADRLFFAESAHFAEMSNFLLIQHTYVESSPCICAD